MKKLVLTLAVFVAAGMMFTGCGDPKPANEYTLKGTVETNGNPAEVYMSYRIDGENMIDTAVVVDNSFEFKGIADEPFGAMLIVNYALAEQLDRRTADSRELYVEAGVITLTTADSLKNATVSGSPVNADAELWKEQSFELEKQRAEYTRWLYSLPLDERSSPEVRTQAQEKMGVMRAKITELSQNFIAAHPDSWFALSAIYRNLAHETNPEGAQEMLNLFSERVRATALGKAKQAEIDAWRTTVVGQVAPDFTLNDTNDNPVKLSDLRGKYVLIDFWASWCGPCRGENPHVVEAYHKYKDKGFTILGVSLDSDKEQWLKAIEDDKLEWTHVSDLKGWKSDVAKLYAVSGIPANWLLDPDGVIIARDLHGAGLEEALEEYLGGE